MRIRRPGALYPWCAAAVLTLATARELRAEPHPAQIAAGIHAEQHDSPAAEVRQYQEAAAERDAQQRAALLDAFVAKYPDSKLMPQVLSLYFPAYMELKNYRKAFEYADKMLMLGAPFGPEGRIQALYVRCKTFPNVYDPNAPDAGDQLSKNRLDALEAFRLIAKLPKPAGSTLTDDEFLASKKNLASEMLDVAADADLKLHDDQAAADELNGALANNPADGWADYSLGVLYLKQSPPKVADGFWYLARAVPARPDADAAIRRTLRNMLMGYQHSSCEVAADAEMSEMIRRAATSPQRPADFTIPAKLSQEQERLCAPQETMAAAPAHVAQNATPAASPAAPPATRSKTKIAASSAPSAPEATMAVAANAQPPALHRGFAPEETPKAAAIQPSGRYYALVIGINDYIYAPKLRTAVKDAQAVAAVLRQQYGFQTRVLTDATREQIIHAITDYRKTLDDSANLLIYYAGHGVYDKEADKTYWLPSDGEITDNSNWIMADEITTDIKVIPARHILIISDSCYSGGITRGVDPAFTPQERGRYLEKMMAGKSRTLMSSGGLEPVSDEGDGGHSVFAGALLRGLTAEEDATFSAENLFEEFIRISVSGQSDQTPQYTVIRNSGHDAGDFVFVRSTATSASH